MKTSNFNTWMVNVAQYVLIMLQKTEHIYNVYFSRYSKKSATILVPINVALKSMPIIA